MVSLLLSCWLDRQANEYRFRLVRTDTAEEIAVKDSVLLLRVTIDEQGQVMRCQLRDLNSGRDAYLQSSATTRLFFQDCVRSEQQDSKPPDTTLSS